MENLKDRIVECLHCERGSCYEQHIDEQTVTWLCLACGFQTSTMMTPDSPIVKTILESSPELYKDLMYTDENNHVWFPATITVPELGMIFLDGTSKEDWRWSAVKAIPITKEDRKTKKYPKSQTLRMDVANKIQFQQNEFIVAMDFLGLLS